MNAWLDLPGFEEAVARVVENVDRRADDGFLDADRAAAYLGLSARPSMRGSEGEAQSGRAGSAPVEADVRGGRGAVVRVEAPPASLDADELPLGCEYVPNGGDRGREEVTASGGHDPLVVRLQRVLRAVLGDDDDL